MNRRTVVDQATREAEALREALKKPELAPVASALRLLAADASDALVAISTLRGEFADNAEWRSDPARAAIVIGTVDMIGSRLLFSGYGCGFKSRPLHGGFLGQDSLLVHDEAHLEPAFQHLIAAIEAEQRRCSDVRPLRVMALTATTRAESADFSLTDEDRGDARVRQRVEARKGLKFHTVSDEKDVAKEVARLALDRADSGGAILVFVRRLEDVSEVVRELHRGKVASDAIQILTGTLRGRERDALARRDPVFARFLRDARGEGKGGTVYLVCTSAGEVGIDMSADHVVCDLTPFESMVQRFGRVNRFGEGDARIDVVERPLPHLSVERSDGGEIEDGRGEPDVGAGEAEDDDVETGRKRKADGSRRFDLACARTSRLLRRLPRRDDERLDASPAALTGLPAAERREAFTPAPRTLPVTDVLFDAWALTSVRGPMPGRPPVADWLHGVEGQPPETHVAWRDEVELLAPDVLAGDSLADVLDDYPLKPHEVLRDRTDRVVACLQRLAERHPSAPVWVVGDDGSVERRPLDDLAGGAAASKQQRNIAESKIRDRIVVLPSSVGGLLEDGRLDPDAAYEDGRRYDVADLWMGEDGSSQRRCRVWDDDPPPPGMRLIRVIDTRPDADEVSDADDDVVRRYWRWYVRPRSADDDGSRTATEPQSLQTHLDSAGRAATDLVRRLGLGETEAAAIEFAARWHDRGKHRAVWQRSIRNGDYPKVVLAKSAGRLRSVELGGYRHELGSVLDIQGLPEYASLTRDAQELAAHLTASHHGRARPHFPIEEAFDPNNAAPDVAETVRAVPRRFAHLQRRYGRWGLAYLESIVRAADALASQSVGVKTLTVEAAATGGGQSMNPTSQPPLRVRVDPSNPGQFFACCGLLELADRLWSGVEAWFEPGYFLISAADPHASHPFRLDSLLTKAAAVELEQVDAGDDYASPLHIAPPFELRLDWWKDVRAGGARLKVWAGSMEIVRIARAMQTALHGPEFHGDDMLDRGLVAYDADGKKKREPFYFDARRGSNAQALDIGFSPDSIQMTSVAYPAVEFLCLIGVQRFRPHPTATRALFEYHTWASPLPVHVAPLAVVGKMTYVGGTMFRFENAFRTDQRKHKGFGAATPIGRSRGWLSS